jgi:zinc/manganese transport system permease protein
MIHAIGKIDLTAAFSQPFFLHAFLAGTAIAAACGLVGYFLIQRAQVFTGDALSHVAFTGALAALAIGIDARVGLFTATIAIALLLGALGQRGRADDVVIGAVFSWVLGLRVFFLTLYTTHRATANSQAGVNALFGSIYGLNAAQTRTAVLIAAVIIIATVLIARPLLFASIEPAVAAARGVPVKTLGFGFLALTGAASAEATQAVGALLLLGLLAAPAGAARHLTHRPFRAMALSVLPAITAMWTGLALSHTIPHLPPSFSIITTSTATYATAALWHAIRRRAVKPRSHPLPQDCPSVGDYRSNVLTDPAAAPRVARYANPTPKRYL